MGVTDTLNLRAIKEAYKLADWFEACSVAHVIQQFNFLHQIAVQGLLPRPATHSAR